MTRQGSRLARLEADAPQPAQNYLMADLAIARWFGHPLTPKQGAELDAWEASGKPADERTGHDPADFDKMTGDLVAQMVRTSGQPIDDESLRWLRERGR